MLQTRSSFFLTAWLAVSSTTAQGAQPTVAQFKQALDAQLQKLKPTGTTTRTVLFGDVRPGRPNGGVYPFEVTATIHDYGPGYPANRFYGATCVGRMDRWRFDMLLGPSGGWIVQGRMTVSDATCKDNPSEGTSAIPLAGLAGERAPKAQPGDERPAQPEKGASNLYLGEYACYGVGSRLMAGMGFRLAPGGTYTDVDGRRGGSYTFDPSGPTLAFRGGFLDGQLGRDVRAKGFRLSSTVSCEPWR